MTAVCRGEGGRVIGIVHEFTVNRHVSLDNSIDSVVK